MLADDPLHDVPTTSSEPDGIAAPRPDLGASRPDLAASRPDLAASRPDLAARSGVAGPVRPLRVAVVGAGPAGIYAADHLTADVRSTDGRNTDGRNTPGNGVLVDLIERLPVPFGLLRYGVAPDHVNIKATGRALGEVLVRPGVRLFANVDVGRDVSVQELRERYDAVVYALGASDDRRIGIPDEDLPGSISATSFVSWYNGHPEGSSPAILQARAVAVVGVGNVALDVARILLRDAEELSPTDVPQEVLTALCASRVTDVHLLGRRGPEHAKFTTKELRELGELGDVAVVVDDGQLPAEPPEGATPVAVRNLAVLRDWAARDSTGARRRLHLHFGARPVQILGTDRVDALRLAGTSTDDGPDRHWDLPVQAVVRAVGYRGSAPPGVPFDDDRGTIPSGDGRVLRDGEPSPGEYAAGWIKRGPTGLLGSNRSDARDTVNSIKADAATLLADRHRDPGGIGELLVSRGIRYVDVDGWHAVVDAEGVHGEPHGRGRVKISDWQSLLEAADGGYSAIAVPR